MAPGHADHSLKDWRVLVTRPASRADSLLDALQRRGARTLHVPLLTIDALTGADLEPARQRVLELDRYDALIFISVNAVEHGAELIESLWPQWPARQRCFAIGAATAGALHARGLRVEGGDDLSAGAMNSEALLAHPALQTLEHQKIAIVRGAGGRETLADTLTARGAQVDYIECYRRSPPTVEPKHFLQQLQEADINATIINSGESLENLTTLLPEQHPLFNKPVIVPSERVAAIAAKLGYAKAIPARNAGTDATVAALEAVPAPS
ncbi:uroporphyrinogen-III synthase [Litorivivens lipolytica]|uniref:Uroporphyrinogen-III synthase n=1 Tax=Litorivivens lipolytica TaxID=1524264 RepID=A0A7W4W769_9GAMM|nr:uroporphyrinogen-III synthase [Litorivivens lipolytica]MBB3048776.1 uroporphyrinogen-III synthase [Litorivivens lipolytica]